MMRKKIRRKAVNRKKAIKIVKKNTVSKKPLTRKDCTDFKKQLNKIKEKLLDQIKNISEDSLKLSQREASGDISGYAFHMADAATDTYDREFSAGLASNDRELLYEIADAIKRMEEKKFGICESCKKNITKTRLRAIPYTRLCLQCQQDREKH